MKYKTLSNGLKCVFIPDTSFHSVSLLLLVKTGSKNECYDQDLYVLSHF